MKAREYASGDEVGYGEVTKDTHPYLYLPARQGCIPEAHPATFKVSFKIQLPTNITCMHSYQTTAIVVALDLQIIIKIVGMSFFVTFFHIFILLVFNDIFFCYIVFLNVILIVTLVAVVNTRHSFASFSSMYAWGLTPSFQSFHYSAS